jgi:hypothetical protein
MDVSDAYVQLGNDFKAVEVGLAIHGIQLKSVSIIHSFLSQLSLSQLKLSPDP